MYSGIYPVTAADMDVNYRMTPAAALLYFQDCYASYLAHNQISAFDLVKEGKIWVITDFDLHFIGERAMWLDVVKVRITLSEITSCRAYIAYELAIADTGRVFAKGESTWVVLDIESRRPCNIVEILDRAGAQSAGIRHRGKNNPVLEDKELLKTVKHEVNPSDLDFNGHVCNRSYMRMAIATVDLDFVRISNPVHVHIRFVKESFLGQTLDVMVYRDRNDANQLFHDIRNQDGELICTVYSRWKTDREGLSRDVCDLIRR